MPPSPTRLGLRVHAALLAFQGTLAGIGALIVIGRAPVVGSGAAVMAVAEGVAAVALRRQLWWAPRAMIAVGIAGLVFMGSMAASIPAGQAAGATSALVSGAALWCAFCTCAVWYTHRSFAPAG